MHLEVIAKKKQENWRCYIRKNEDWSVETWLGYCVDGGCILRVKKTSEHLI
jgi:hypothetical protein